MAQTSYERQQTPKNKPYEIEIEFDNVDWMIRINREVISIDNNIVRMWDGIVKQLRIAEDESEYRKSLEESDDETLRLLMNNPEFRVVWNTNNTDPLWTKNDEEKFLAQLAAVPNTVAPTYRANNYNVHRLTFQESGYGFDGWSIYYAITPTYHWPDRKKVQYTQSITDEAMEIDVLPIALDKLYYELRRFGLEEVIERDFRRFMHTIPMISRYLDPTKMSVRFRKTQPDVWLCELLDQGSTISYGWGHTPTEAARVAVKHAAGLLLYPDWEGDIDNFVLPVYDSVHDKLKEDEWVHDTSSFAVEYGQGDFGQWFCSTYRYTDYVVSQDMTEYADRPSTARAAMIQQREMEAETIDRQLEWQGRQLGG